MTKQSSKEETIVIAAKKRAVISEFINNRGTPAPFKTVSSYLDSLGIHIDEIPLKNFLTSMVNAKLISKMKSDDPTDRVAYLPFNSKVVVDKVSVKPTSVTLETKHLKPPVKVSAGNAPDFKIVFVKKTGNMRVTFNGLFIEIGVVEE